MSQIIRYGTFNKYNCLINKRGTPLKDIYILSIPENGHKTYKHLHTLFHTKQHIINYK